MPSVISSFQMDQISLSCLFVLNHVVFLLFYSTREDPNIFLQWSNAVSLSAVTFSADLELELGELLQEFQDVVEEMKAPSQSRPHVYQHILQEAKSRTGPGDDSGVEDSDYSE